MLLNKSFCVVLSNNIYSTAFTPYSVEPFLVTTATCINALWILVKSTLFNCLWMQKLDGTKYGRYNKANGPTTDGKYMFLCVIAGFGRCGAQHPFNNQRPNYLLGISTQCCKIGLPFFLQCCASPCLVGRLACCAQRLLAI